MSLRKRIIRWIRRTLSQGAKRRNGIRFRPTVESLEGRIVPSHNIPDWIAQGPAPLTNGQVENVPSTGPGVNPVVGAIHDIALHPTNADIAFLGTTNGGVWRSINFTSLNPTYTPLTGHFPGTSIGAVEFDPTDLTNNTVYAGVGRFSSFSQAGTPLTGLLRTTDGGATWSQVGVANLTGRNIAGVQARGNTIVVATNTFGTGIGPGVYRSTDGGGTFSFISGTGGLAVGSALDLIGDPTNNLRMYVSIQSIGIYRSNDAGSTWTNVSSANAMLNGFITGGGNNNLEMTVSPTTGRLYGGVVINGQLRYVGFSDNQGGTWTPMDIPATTDAEGTHSTSPTAKPGAQGYIHFSIVADPLTATTVYIGGDRQPFGFPNSLGANDYTGRLFRGDTTQTATAPGTLVVGSPQWDHLTHRQNFVFAGGGTASNSAPHADSRDMAFRADGQLVEVDDGGIYRRTNPQNNTGDWFSLMSDAAGGLQVNEQHDIAYDSVSNIIISGNQDAGTGQQTAPGSLVWQSVSTADGGDVAVDNLIGGGQSVRYASFQNLGTFRRRVYNSAGGLVSTQSPALTGFAADVQFVTPLAVNEVAPDRLIIGGATNTYESMNRGDNVSIIGAGVFVNASAIAYGASLSGVPNPNALFVGSGFTVYGRTAAGPITATNPLPAGASTVRGVEMHPNNYNNVFAIDNNQVFMSGNAGGLWSDITGNMPDTNLRSIAYIDNATGPDAILVAGDGGVYRALTSSMGVWTEFGLGLPNTTVYEMDYDASDDVLVVGTLGRGAWAIPNLSQTVFAVDDPFEPNNTQPTATILATLTAFDLSIEGITDRDFFRFTAQQTGSLPITIYFDAATNNLDLRIRNSGGAIIATGTQTLLPGLDEESLALSATAGTDYWIEVFSTLPNVSIYDLEIKGEPPQIDLNGVGVNGAGIDFSTIFTEDGPAVLVGDTDLTVIDPDSSLLTSATITITNLQDGVDEVLTADVSGTSIVAAYNTSTGVLSLTGADTLAHYQQVLRTLAYSDFANAPSIVDRIVTVALSDGSFTSVIATATIAVIAVNDAPILDNLATMSLDPIDEDAINNSGMLVSAILSSAASSPIADVDGPQQGIAVTGVSDVNGGFWQFSINSGSDWSNFDPVSETEARLLATNGSTRVRFRPGPNFNGVVSGLTFRAWDQSNGILNGDTDDSNGATTAYSSATVTAGIIVQPVNDPPTIDLNGTDEGGVNFDTSFAEDGLPAPLGDSDLAIADIDSAMLASASVSITNRSNGAAESLTVDTTGTSITASFLTSNGVLNLTGAATPAHYALVLQTVRYNNTSQNPGTADRIVRTLIYDSSGDNAQALTTISVSATNDTPTDISLSNSSVREDLVVGAAVRALTTADSDPGSSHTYSFVTGDGSDDNTSFAIINNNQLSTAIAFDFETRSSYSVRIKSVDQSGAFVEKALTITVTNVNEAPSLTLTTSAVTLDENTSTINRIAVAQINVVDDAGDTGLVTLSGADAGAFEVSGDHLYLKADTTLDFESKTQYQVTVEVDDAAVGDSPDDSASFTLNVANVNEAPTALNLTNLESVLLEGVNPSRIRVADIGVVDDALGSEAFSLSGPDDSLFEIVGAQLFLRSGVTLNFVDNPRLDVTVRVDDTTVGVSPADASAEHSIIVAVPVMANSTRVLEDDDGDGYVIQLKGPGQAAVAIVSNSSGAGPIGQIVLSGTNSLQTKLVIGISRTTAGQTTFGDGFIDIGSITGSGVASIVAKNSDLVGTGIDLDGPLGKLILRDIRAGAVIDIEGSALQRTTIKANTIAPDITITTGTFIKSLTATAVGDGSITAPGIGKLVVSGDFNANLNLSGNLFSALALGSARIGGNIANADWTIVGNVNKVTVGGNTTSWNVVVHGSLTRASVGNALNSFFDVATLVSAFSAGVFMGSKLYAGFSPTIESSPMQGGPFAFAAAIKSFKAAGFSDSIVAATTIGDVTLDALDSSNATAFGILAHTSIAALVAPSFLFDPTQTLQVLDAFQVKII